VEDEALRDGEQATAGFRLQGFAIISEHIWLV
jgi:hypothetical protein